MMNFYFSILREDEHLNDVLSFYCCPCRMYNTFKKFIKLIVKLVVKFGFFSFRFLVFILVFRLKNLSLLNKILTLKPSHSI